MAWFKKKASPEDFGHVAFHMASTFLSTDAGRSLGMQFSEYDASSGWTTFLESRGISLAKQKLYFRLFSHCAVQACATQFDFPTRRAITQGAMELGFATPIAGYDFASMYSLYESALNGEHEFDLRIHHLTNPSSRIHFLAHPDAGVNAAKVLIETFVFQHMPNPEAFIDNFESFSSTVGASIGTTNRAISQLLESVTIVR